jgi:hypothetical protein
VNEGSIGYSLRLRLAVNLEKCYEAPLGASGWRISRKWLEVARELARDLMRALLLRGLNLPRLLAQRHWLVSQSFYPVFAVVLLLLPLRFTGRPTAVPEPGSPVVVGGDEPHYLVLINSLLSDGDLNLANNYESVHRGGMDAGKLASERRFIEHHTLYLVDGRPVHWYEVHGAMPEAHDWAVNADGRFGAPVWPGAAAPPAGAAEYSSHQPGMAFLLAPVLLPFRGTPVLESMALLCSGLATVAAFFFFRRLLRHLQAPERAVNLISLIAFLGTTVWFYGRSLFPESFLLLCSCGACTLAITGGSVWLCGVFVAVAIQLKAYYVLLAVPLGIDFLAHRQWRGLAVFSSIVMASIALFLVQNQIFFGDWRTSAQAFVPGSFMDGAVGLLFSRQWGLLFFSPIVVMALACWPSLVRAYRREALLLGSVAFINFCLIANYQTWYGGNCVGPRYLVPFIPFLFAALAAPGCSPMTWRFPTKAAFFVLGLLSVYANADAAIRAGRYWGTNPLVHYGEALARKIGEIR